MVEMIREMGAISSRDAASLKVKLAQLETKVGEVASSSSSASASASAAAAAAEEKADRVGKEAAVEVASAWEAARMDAAKVNSGIDALRMHVISLKRRMDDGKRCFR